MCFQICVFSKGSGARAAVPPTKSRRNSRTRPRTQPQTRARTCAAAACEAPPQPARKPTEESGKPPRSPQIAGCGDAEQPPRRKAARQITALRHDPRNDPPLPSESAAPLQPPIIRNSATENYPMNLLCDTIRRTTLRPRASPSRRCRVRSHGTPQRHTPRF